MVDSSENLRILHFRKEHGRCSEISSLLDGQISCQEVSKFRKVSGQVYFLSILFFALKILLTEVKCILR